MAPELRVRDDLRVVGPEREWVFDAAGDIAAATDPLVGAVRAA
jgi:hypothetical protein